MSIFSRRKSLLFLFTLGFTSSCQRPPDRQVPKPTSGISTRIISHAMGESEVVSVPQKVVTIDTAALDTAMTLGVKPIGAMYYQKAPDYLGDKLKNITVLGLENTPNLETISSLKPDLILGTKLSSKNIYSKLIKIAPTILTEGSGRTGDDEWQQNFLLHGLALGKEAEAKKLLEQYQKQVLQVKQQISAKFSKPPIVSVIASGAGRLGTFTQWSFSGTVLQDLGLQRPQAQIKPGKYAVQLSKEDSNAIDGDFIFLIEYANNDKGYDRDKFINDPIFGQLQTVKNGQVFGVKAEVWTIGRSYLAALEIIKDVQTGLQL